MSPFLVFGSGLKASLVDASQCCWCWCCTSVGDDVDIDVDNMGVSSSHCVEPEWYHDWLINWLIALEEYYLLIVVVLPVQFYETMAVHTVRVLGMHPLISMQPPHSHQSPVTILCFVPLCSLPACLTLSVSVSVFVDVDRSMCCFVFSVLLQEAWHDEVPGGGAIRTVNYLKFWICPNTSFIWRRMSLTVLIYWLAGWHGLRSFPAPMKNANWRRFVLSVSSSIAYIAA